MNDSAVETHASRYSRYIEEITDDIADTVQRLGCQPIIFVGSGLARRYIGAPSWDELLKWAADQCELIDKGLGFYKQLFHNPAKIGEEFARIYQEWAWTSGKNYFPEDMFHADIDAQSYLKYLIAQHLASITPGSADTLLKSEHGEEIAALQNIRPHAIITTNFDKMMELIFSDHHPIVGQHILRGQQIAVGEIFKIHGCVSEYNSLVLTQTDYDNFFRKKKFLSAKLLTFFNEHPLLFVGYSASDPNIQTILADIDEALPEKEGLIPNVYILQWNPEVTDESSPAREKVIPTEEDRTIRVKLIEANDFTWVYDAFSINPPLNNVNPRVLRALVARSYYLVRKDIPKMPMEVDFSMLSKSVENANEFATVFGLAEIDDYSKAAALHPYTATQLGKLLGGNGWHRANALIDRVKSDKGFDMKASDNRYHRCEKLNKTIFHKYSEDAHILLEKVRDGLDYEVNIE